MDPYLKRYNNYVNIPEILTASGKRMSDTATQQANLSCVGMAFWGDAAADFGAGLPGAILKRVNPLKRSPTASPTSSAKGFYIS
jgi:hypothetical protein